MGSKIGVISQKVASWIDAVRICLLPFFSFFSTYILRLQKCGGNSLKKNDKDIIFPKDVKELGDYGYDDMEEEKPELRLKFKFPTFEEFSRIQRGKGNMFTSEVVHFGSTGKYEFTSGKSFLSAFVKELETFPVKEIDGNKIGEVSENKDVFSGRKFEVHEETGDVQEEGEVIVRFDGEENENNETEFAEKLKEKGQPIQEDVKFLDESEFLYEKKGYDFLSEGDFGGQLGIDSEKEITGLETELLGVEENQESPEHFVDGESDIMEEVKKLEDHGLQKNNELNSDFLSEKDFNENLDDKNDANPKTKESSALDSGDANKLESLWEHQELIEQLKMELRKVRATGLPTILEESESPKIIDELKPWKIDEKFQHEDCMDELHKFYKNYREMMRRFDILNYQKMYAMGFLQLKDPFQPTSQQKPSTPTLKSLVSENLWLFKHKSHGSDPIKKFINELQGDLEVIYVGQACLSWEFLHWQYEKALELWHSDPHGVHQYNEVAGEFQQFQVLMQRFIEDGPFQGPRVQSYVKSRCVLRNLLQVPLIREDNMNDKKKPRKKDRDEYVITSDMLVEIVEESIRIFWVFVRSDKDCNTLATNGHKKMPELNNPEDLKLLADVRKTLQKKERKIKDILRSENCILRKFRQRREDDSDHVLYFFAQVDMKLVSRVLNMSRITREQLQWCQNKLSRISFVHRKIYVEPTFLLFPC